MFDDYPDEPIGPDDVVMLGDSLIGYGDWKRLLPDLPLRNYGIPGDTVGGVLGRLETIISARPRAVLLLIGTNDLSLWMRRAERHILSHIDSILRRLRRGSPDTLVTLQSLLPREAMLADAIRRLNCQLALLADEHNCDFLDLFDHFADPGGGLRPEFTGDGLHLTAAGYRCWAELLEPHLCELTRADDPE